MIFLSKISIVLKRNLTTGAESNATELLNEIRETGALPDADKFDSAITEFKKGFNKSEE